MVRIVFRIRKKVYEKSLTLRQNMRDNLSNEKTKKLFILFLKTLSKSIKSYYNQQLSDKTYVQIFITRYVLNIILKIALIFKNNLVLMLHII